MKYRFLYLLFFIFVNCQMPKSQSSNQTWLRTLVEYKNLADDFYLHYKDEDASVKRKRSESYFEFELEPHLEEIGNIICVGDSMLLGASINILATDSGSASESLSSFGYDIFECVPQQFIRFALRHNIYERIELSKLLEAGYYNSTHKGDNKKKKETLLKAIAKLKE